jgi:hypothetical protein
MKIIQIVGVCCLIIGLGTFQAFCFPYQTGFEAPVFNIGDINGQDNWTVPSGSVLIQNETSFEGLQAAELEPLGQLEKSLSMNGESVVWVEAYAIVNSQDITPDIAGMDAASCVLYYSTTGGITCLDGDGTGGGTWVSTGISVDSIWTKITLRQDYTNHSWELYVNGNKILSDLGFKDNTIDKLSGFYCQAGDSGSMYLDNFYVSAMEPDSGRIYSPLNLFELAEEWHNETDFISETHYDFNSDEIVDTQDLLEFIDKWVNQ